MIIGHTGATMNAHQESFNKDSAPLGHVGQRLFRIPNNVTDLFQEDVKVELVHQIQDVVVESVHEHVLERALREGNIEGNEGLTFSCTAEPAQPA